MQTIAILSVGWAALAALVGKRASRLRESLTPKMQVRFLGAAIVGLAGAPVAVLTLVLARNLTAVGAGSRLTRCGRLIMAVLSNPLARPEITAALAMLAFFVVGIAWGTVRTWRSQACVRRLTKGHRDRLVVIRSDVAMAFTTGLFRPKIVISTGLMQQADRDSLRVVIAHEEAHRRGHDPLVLFATESLARGLAFWPLASTANRLRLALEMRADDAAADSVGSRLRVANVISNLALMQTPASVGFEGDTVARVRRLMDGSGGGRPIMALAIAGAALFVIVFSGGHALHYSRLSYDALRTPACPMSVDASHMQ